MRVGRLAHEIFEGLALGALTATIVVGSAFVWIGVPLGGLWLVGRLTTTWEHSLLFALCVIPTAMV